MSFVLEALQKQEAAGDPDAAVSLARQATERRRYRLWAGLFAAAVVVNLLVLGWVFGPLLLREAVPPAPDPSSAAVAPQAAVSRPPEPQPAARLAEPVAVAAPTAAPGPATRPARAQPTPTGPATEARATDRPGPAPRPLDVALRDLPAAARARFPGLAFSTHIYAEDADLRAIVANGQRLSEGDRVSGLEIVEITETGVVLAFERYRVHVPIVTDW